MHSRILTVLGMALLTLGLLGPFTFADDLRHFGEIAVVIALTVSGLCLLTPKLTTRMRCSGSFPVASPFVLAGLIVGVFSDRAVTGVLLGACLGAIATWRHCAKSRRVAN